jgi:hypothetical protein
MQDVEATVRKHDPRSISSRYRHARDQARALKDARTGSGFQLFLGWIHTQGKFQRIQRAGFHDQEQSFNSLRLWI